MALPNQYSSADRLCLTRSSMVSHTWRVVVGVEEVSSRSAHGKALLSLHIERKLACCFTQDRMQHQPVINK
jgi:hypothetical protein